MSYWKAPHRPLHTALACALHDSRYKGRFVSWDAALTVCSIIAPEGYTAKQHSLINALKGADDSVTFDIYNALNESARAEIGCVEGTVMRLMKNIRVSKTGRCHYVGVFGPEDAVPTETDMIAIAKSDSNSNNNERLSARGERRLVIPGGVQAEYNEYAKLKFHHASLPPENAQTKPKRTQQKPQRDEAKKKRPNTADAPRPAPNREEEIEQLQASLADLLLQRRKIESSIIN